MLSKWEDANLLLRGKAAKSGLLVRKIGKDGMEVRETQDFLCAGTKIHSSQLRLVLASREETADQLPDPGAVEIGNVPKIQQHALFAVLKKVHQKIVHRFALNKRKPAADVNDRYFTQLSRARAESQANPLQENLYSYRFRATSTLRSSQFMPLAGTATYLTWRAFRESEAFALPRAAREGSY